MTECATETLEAFVKARRQELDEFEKYWKRAHEIVPENYPMAMSGGDWDEALYMFPGAGADIYDQNGDVVKENVDG